MFQLALAAWRNAPRTDGFSPAQALFGRVQRQALPIHLIVAEERMDHGKFEAKRTGTHHGMERAGCTLPMLMPGDDVLVQDKHTLLWSDEGSVEGITGSGSYWINLSDGRRIRRNHRFIRKL